MPKLDVGQLRHRVTWQSPGTPVLDKFNQRTAPWVTHGDYWARVEPLTGFELVNAKQLKPELSTKVTIRNVGPIKPTDRLLFTAAGRALNVVFVFRLDERNAYLTLHCTESAI